MRLKFEPKYLEKCGRIVGQRKTTSRSIFRLDQVLRFKAMSFGKDSGGPITTYRFTLKNERRMNELREFYPNIINNLEIGKNLSPDSITDLNKLINIQNIYYSVDLYSPIGRLFLCDFVQGVYTRHST